MRSRKPSALSCANVASDVNRVMSDHWQSKSFQRWLFYSMSWAVLHCAKPEVTIPDCGMVRGLGGLLDHDAEFYLPLSATRVMVASWEGAPPDEVQLLTASPAHLRHINKLGFGLAGRLVYGQRRSEKVAMAVRRQSRHSATRLKGPKVAGGPNPKVTSLSGLKHWLANVLDDSDDPDRHYCVAPGMGDEHRHGWGKPVERSVREAPEIKVSDRICKWCGARERRHPNGQVKFRDGELERVRAQLAAKTERKTVDEHMKNWWQRWKVEGTDTHITAALRPHPP